MRKSELLERLRGAVAPAEWDALASGRPLAVSEFNRSTLLEMRSASAAGDGEVSLERAEGLYKTLQAYLAEHMAQQPEGWKWVILSSLYLALIAGRPMHPAGQMGIKETVTEEGVLYECPAKSAVKNTACDYCICKRMSNYEITKRQMARKFVTYDQAEMVRRFGLRGGTDWIEIRFLNCMYRICRSDGVIFRQEGDSLVEAGFNEAMTIYDVLCNAEEGCALSGEFVTLGSLIQAANAPGKSGNLFGQKFQIFDHREQELSRACEQLGGVRFGKGDVAYRLPLFDFLPVALQFWNSDDEFPASLQLLWDGNTLRYMHFETVWYAAGHLLDKLTGLLGDALTAADPSKLIVNQENNA